MIEITADFQSSQNYLMEFLLLDIADLFFQSSYRILCLTVKNHVVEKTGPRAEMSGTGILFKPKYDCQNYCCEGSQIIL